MNSAAVQRRTSTGHNWLVQQARVSPTGPAVVHPGGTLTYAELLARASASAVKLKAAGLARGNRLAILGRNSLDYVLALHASLLLGAVAVPLNVRQTRSDIANHISLARCSHFLDGISFGNTSGDMAHMSLEEITDVDPHAGESFDFEALDFDDVVALLFTSGTTGLPRPVSLTLGNFFSGAVASVLRLGHRSDDSWLLSLPLYHVGGLSILFRSLLSGIPMCLPRSPSIPDLAEAIDTARPTLASFVGTMLQRLVEADVSAGALRAVLLGGGPVTPAMVSHSREAGWPVLTTYGATETCAQFATMAPEAGDPVDSVGKPLLFNRIKIVSEDGEEVESGNPGEIVVSGPTISPSVADDSGWYWTGDRGRVDTNGFLYVDGRRSDLIVSGGENIDPVEIENALMQHPEIREVCVFGTDDNEWGRIVTAAVVLRDGTADQNGGVRDRIDRFVRQNIAGFKAPRRYYFVESLPRNEMGKVVRRTVEAFFEKEERRFQ